MVVGRTLWTLYSSTFYRLFVAASDLGDVYGGARLTSHTLVEITVVDVNDHAPRICLRPQRHASSPANHSRPITASRPQSDDCRNASSVTVETRDAESLFLWDSDSDFNSRNV